MSWLALKDITEHVVGETTVGSAIRSYLVHSQPQSNDEEGGMDILYSIHPVAIHFTNIIILSKG